MIAVFKQAGYEVRQRTEDGVVAVGFDIDPTDRSLAVMADREHRAEALSMRGVLHASSVVVVGPGTHEGETLAGRLAARVLADLLVGDPSVVVHAVGVPGDQAVQVHARLRTCPDRSSSLSWPLPPTPRPTSPESSRASTCAGSSC